MRNIYKKLFLLPYLIKNIEVKYKRFKELIRV